jgi:hypothetical protein
MALPCPGSGTGQREPVFEVSDLRVIFWSEWQDLNLRPLVPNEVLYRPHFEISRNFGPCIFGLV